MMILKDKVVIVIGGCGLIGREIVKDIRRKGGICINADISTETDWGKGEYKLDMTDFSEIENFIGQVKERYGRIDGIANSGYPRTKDWGAFFEDVSLESWRKNVDMQLNS